MGRNTREQANELAAVAPLVSTSASPQLVGPCTLVTNGARTIAIASAEHLRLAPEPLAIALTYDGSRTLPVASWAIGRNIGIGIVELAQPFPVDERVDVAPLSIASVCATVDTRGAPASLVGVVGEPGKWSRKIVPVYVDAIDGGPMSDEVLARLASPRELADASVPVEGFALIAWLPSDAVLGRGPETVIVALAVSYRARTFKPREAPVVAELVGLDDLGRALPFTPQPQAEASNELGQVAGEIRAPEGSGPLAGLGLDDDATTD